MKVLHFIFAIILKTKLIWLALFLTIYLNPRKKVDGKKLKSPDSLSHKLTAMERKKL